MASSGDISKFLAFADDAAIKTCLDIGCGTGQLTRELSHRGYRCVGIDASASAVKRAQSLTAVPAEHLSYLRFDIEHDDMKLLPRAQYSLITCKLVYAFIEDREIFFSRVAQLLAPDGLFVVVTPLPEDVTPEKRGIAAAPEAMRQLAEAFEQVALYKSGTLTYFVGQHRVPSLRG